MSATWCAPCIAEARYEFPPRYDAYRHQGGQFLSVLAQGGDLEPADATDLVQWTDSVGALYPSAIDPTRKLAPFFPSNAFPWNAIVDTRTMRVTRYENVVNEAFWAAFDELLGVESMSCFVLDQSGCPAGEACDLSAVTGMFYCRPADPAGIQGASCPGGDSTFCAAGYYCSPEQVCEAFCTDASTCGAFEDCLAIVTGVGACQRRACTIIPQKDCPVGEACDLADGSGTPYCRPIGSGVQGDACLAAGNPAPSLCGAGYRCSPAGICEAFCEDSSSCTGGAQCDAIAGALGACHTPPCTVLPQAGCPVGQACDLDAALDAYCRNAAGGTQGSPCYLGGNPTPAACDIGFSCSTNQVCEAFCADASTCGGLSCSALMPGVGLCE
ncbi:MAG: hypothetical protein IT373_18810 [Polyangiaceae bacterium]|nr:hypothetical protein [Polyangiaceae bacterium]